MLKRRRAECKRREAKRDTESNLFLIKDAAVSKRERGISFV